MSRVVSGEVVAGKSERNGAGGEKSRQSLIN